MSIPTLTDSRVESMRSTVMNAVDADISRRGRTGRRALRLVAAGVLVIGLGSAVLPHLNGLSSGTSGGSAVSSSGSSSSSGDAVAPEVPPKDGPSDRQVITTGSISVVVTNPRTTADTLSAWIESVGGRVDSRNEGGRGDETTAQVKVRVPSNKVSATIAQLKKYGTVKDVSLQNDDVTAAAQDLDARIDALQLSIGRLEQILGRADTSGEVIAAESALTKRQEQLERLQAERTSMADQVSLSTLDINLTQKAQVRSVEPGGFRGGLRDGWNALVSTINSVVEVAGVLLPWAAIGLVLLGAHRLIDRRRR